MRARVALPSRESACANCTSPCSVSATTTPPPVTLSKTVAAGASPWAGTASASIPGNVNGSNCAAPSPPSEGNSVSSCVVAITSDPTLCCNSAVPLSHATLAWSRVTTIWERGKKSEAECEPRALEVTRLPSLGLSVARSSFPDERTPKACSCCSSASPTSSSRRICTSSPLASHRQATSPTL